MTSTDDYNLTEKESTSLEELRKRISGDINKNRFDETHLIYRFLKARDWNVDEAESMFKRWLQWRKDNKIDTIVKEYKGPEVLEKYFNNWSIGYDKEGCPVFYIPNGRIDIKGFHMAVKYNDLERHIIRAIEESDEYLEEQSKKLHRRLPGYVLIFDVNALTFANATYKKGLEMLIRVTLMQQNFYPERMKAVYFINGATYFTFAYSIIKNFLAPRVVNKFQLFGTEGWQEPLLKAIDADVLPAFLGGNRTDPDGDPLCKTIVNQALPVPEKYYIHKSKNPLADSPDVRKLVLTRASFSEIPIEIREPNSILEWEFDIQNRDIGFGLFYKEAEDTNAELIALRRLETEDFTEAGVFKCEKSGEYVIVFDNSYSWVRSKEILYRVKVVTPQDHENCIQTHD